MFSLVMSILRQKGDVVSPFCFSFYHFVLYSHCFTLSVSFSPCMFFLTLPIFLSIFPSLSHLLLFLPCKFPCSYFFVISICLISVHTSPLSFSSLNTRFLSHSFCPFYLSLICSVFLLPPSLFSVRPLPGRSLSRHGGARALSAG